jgi:hypothetical protein
MVVTKVKAKFEVGKPQPYSWFFSRFKYQTSLHMRCLFSMTMLLSCWFLFSQCVRKNCECAPPVQSNKLSYGDSIFYLKNANYTISPLGDKAGTYTAFPDNLTIDRTTGAITITQKGKDGESQTGMWYKIRYTSTGTGETDSTMILLSGITYLDQFYNLAQKDSIIYPIYNGNPATNLPSGNYDLTSNNKFAINPVNGQINIKECMRRGFFGGQTNEAWKIANIKYEINDKSGGVANNIDIVLYYYHSMDDVPTNVSALMQAHQRMTLGFKSLPAIPTTSGAFDNNIPSSVTEFKPRPPCVIIVGN